MKYIHILLIAFVSANFAAQVLACGGGEPGTKGTSAPPESAYEVVERPPALTISVQTAVSDAGPTLAPERKKADPANESAVDEGASERAFDTLLDLISNEPKEGEAVSLKDAAGRHEHAVSRFIGGLTPTQFNRVMSQLEPDPDLRRRATLAPTSEVKSPLTRTIITADTAVREGGAAREVREKKLRRRWAIFILWVSRGLPVKERLLAYKSSDTLASRFFADAAFLAELCVKDRATCRQIAESVTDVRDAPERPEMARELKRRLFETALQSQDDEFAFQLASKGTKFTDDMQRAFSYGTGTEIQDRGIESFVSDLVKFSSCAQAGTVGIVKRKVHERPKGQSLVDSLRVAIFEHIGS